MDIKEIYNQIGCAGISLVIIGVFALYITVWNFLYLRGVLSKFKKHFHGMEQATPERIRRYFGESTNPLECIVRDIVMTHGAHSDDHSCGSSLLVPQAFQASEQCADLAQVNFRRFSAAGPFGYGYRYGDGFPHYFRERFS